MIGLLIFSSGVVLYYGGTHYISAELYNGRVKVAIYTGNYPSHMYSYTPINDGKLHRLQLIIDEGRRLSMQIDDGEVQKVINSGKTGSFESTSRLYLGGLPREIATKALLGFHLKEAASLVGGWPWEF